jgi:GR25 family glycosyltransferase involved in LPS biosynthesis
MHGLYINLDRAIGRRAKLEAEFERFGLSGRYRRIRGLIDPAPYNGCSRSHIKAITEAGKIGGVVHIIEDDVLMSNRVEPFLRSQRVVDLLATYDIVYLSMWVDPTPDQLAHYIPLLAEAGDDGAVVDMRGPRIGAMDSYVVAPRSIDRVVQLMTAELARVPVMYNDTFIDRMVKAGVLRAATVVPFLTCIDIDVGTRSSVQSIDREEQQRFVKLRTSFFVDRHRQDSFELPRLPPTAR